MVLLPNCQCCDCDECCQLAQDFTSATSLELDVSGGTDHQVSRVAEVVRTPLSGPACGKYPIGTQGVEFYILKLSQMNGTFSLPLKTVTPSASIGGFEERLFEYVYPASPFTCSAPLQIAVYLQNIQILSFPPLVFLRTLSHIVVKVPRTDIFGQNRGDTAIPNISECSRYGNCLPTEEQGGSYDFSSHYGFFLYNTFTCGQAFNLSSVFATRTQSETQFQIGFPSVFGRTSLTDNGLNCAEYISAPPAPYQVTLSFSNLKIVQ